MNAELLFKNRERKMKIWY